MARTKAPSAAVQVSRGSKITFGDDSGEDEQDLSFEAGPSRRQGKQEPESDEEDEEESDDDDAPEAVGVSKSDVGVDDVASAAEMLAQQSRARKEAARIRNQKIAEAKAAKLAMTKGQGKSADKGGKKRKIQEPESDEEDDDEDTRRLKKRMAAAMAQGDDEDSDMELNDSEEEGSEEGEDEDENDDEEEDVEEDEGVSFHTDSEDEESEEEELDDDPSERLEDGPIDDKTRQLRARMQAMMEAAENRARGDAPTASTSANTKSKSANTKSALKPTITQSKVVDEEEDEDAGYDLAPLSKFGKPLSAEVLRKAEEAEKVKLAKTAEAAALANAQRKPLAKKPKKKRKVEPTTKLISQKKALHILPPALNSNFSSDALPPVIDPGIKVGARSKSHNKFYKNAMKSSGIRPGMGVMDGRKRTVAK